MFDNFPFLHDENFLEKSFQAMTEPLELLT